jgi:hypothetical protein
MAVTFILVLTHIDAPPALAGAPGMAAAPAQEAPTPQPDAERRQNGLVALALVVAIFSSSLALGIAFGIRRRIDMLAGPPDDEDE